MAKFLAVFLSIVLHLLRAHASQDTDCIEGVSVVTPGWALPGQETAVLVSVEGARHNQPLNVSVTLLADRVEELTQVIASAHATITGAGVVRVPVPADAWGGVLLQTTLNCSLAADCRAQSQVRLHLGTGLRDLLIRPEKDSYYPGDVVNFWLLAVDHELRLPSGVQAEVSVRNPSGTRVTLWQNVPLDEGVQHLWLPLAGSAEAGQWRVQAQVEGQTYEASFDVLTPGAQGKDADSEMPMAEEHYVELRFGPAMRRVYKPGLPFVGKVEALSTEKCVRVRVKLYDNTTAIYSQDIEISAGEASFTVPAILADSDLIILQAELVSVEGKEIDNHYVLAKESLKKWNSSADCYLLIQGVDQPLQANEVATATVLSTCPCDRNVHVVVTTDGFITHADHRRAVALDEPPTQTVDGAAICRFNISFPVRAEMAPWSRLLVLWVGAGGAPVTDAATVGVRLDARLWLPPRRWLPGDALPLRLSADGGVCLLGGGGAEPPPAAEPPSGGRRQREADVEASGLALFQSSGCGLLRQGGGAGPLPPSVLGAHLRRPWLWRCFQYAAGTTSASVPAPMQPGKYWVRALTLGPGSPLRLSPPVPLTVFRPLSVSFSMPPSLRVGETLEVDVKIGNNIDSCVDVTAVGALTEGAHFQSNGLLYVTEKLRLGPHGATSLVVRVVVTSAGLKNLSVEVSGYSSENCKDSNAQQTNDTLVRSVLQTTSILVHPEGLVRSATESAYFCANENELISTSEDFRYEFMSAPRNRAGVVFEVKVSKGAHIALSDVHYTSDRMYQIVLGDYDNTISWIGRGKHGFGVHLASAETGNILSGDSFRTFWVSWDQGLVAIGKGANLHENTLLKWRLDKKFKVQHMGFASSWGQTGQFRVWNYNEEAGFSQVLHLDVPHPVVPGSEQGTLMITGGLSLPVDVQWPKSSQYTPELGDSTSLAAVIAGFSSLPLVEHKLGNTNQERDELKKNLYNQIQNLLAYRKEDSSFGDHHHYGSYRTTVMVLEIFSKSQAHVNIDPDIIAGVKRWLQQRQAVDGSFPVLSVDVNYNCSESVRLNRDIENTAETLITLTEVGLDTEADSETVLKARYFLERHVFQVTSPTPLALMTYALVLSKSDLAAVILSRLRNVSANQEGDFGWPHPNPDSDAPDWLYEGGFGKHRKEPIPTSVAEYKASLYTLMTYAQLGDLKSAAPVARYLFYRSHLLDRHTELLYLTVKAFAKLQPLALDPHRALTVSLATSGMELTDTLDLRSQTFPQRLQLPSLPTKVFVYATGAGCATVQGHVSYSTYAPSSHTKLLDLWSGIEAEIIPSHNSLDELEGKLPVLRIKTCFRWKGDHPSGVLRMEVTLFSGFQLLSVNPVPLDHNGNILDMHYGSRADKIWFVLTNVSSTCVLCLRYTVQSLYVVASLRPSFARIYPAARPDLAAETFFHTQHGSPLLADITDDDLITWFGKNEQGEMKMRSNFSEICECGQTCQATESPEHAETRTISILQNQEETEETQASKIPTNFSHDFAMSTLKVINESSSKEKKIQHLDMITPQANHLNNTKSNDNGSNFPIGNFTVSNKAIKNAEKILNTKSVNSLLKYNSVKNNSLNTTVTQKITKGDRTTTTTEVPVQAQRTVNKERHLSSEAVHPSLLPTTEEPGTSEKLMFKKGILDPEDDKLFVLDKTTLWGMLREVVHTELNYRAEHRQAASGNNLDDTKVAPD